MHSLISGGEDGVNQPFLSQPSQILNPVGRAKQNESRLLLTCAKWRSCEVLEIQRTWIGGTSTMIVQAPGALMCRALSLINALIVLFHKLLIKYDFTPR